MATVVLPEALCMETSTSSFDRPFKILVQDQTFLIDSESLSKMSPIFSIMCFGKDFDNGRELSREIVDEKSHDIEVFLKAVHDSSIISVNNFTTIFRLSHKYQVEGLVDECESFILNTNLDCLKPDEVLTLLLACHEFHSIRECVVRLIRRLANEEKTTFNRMKLSRFLPAQLYGAIIGANLNLAQVREVEQMNGHMMKMERSRTRWRRAACDECKAITDAAGCDSCHKTLCKYHMQTAKCTTDYGKRFLEELRANIVELDWD